MLIYQNTNLIIRQHLHAKLVKLNPTVILDVHTCSQDMYRLSHEW